MVFLNLQLKLKLTLRAWHAKLPTLFLLSRTLVLQARHQHAIWGLGSLETHCPHTAFKVSSLISPPDVSSLWFHPKFTSARFASPTTSKYLFSSIHYDPVMASSSTSHYQPLARFFRQYLPPLTYLKPLLFTRFLLDSWLVVLGEFVPIHEKATTWVLRGD